MSREFLWEPLWKLATVKAGTTPPRSEGDRFFNGGTINWVKTGDLNDGWLSDTVERITEEAVHETSLIVHPPGTVLVAMYGGFQQIGRSTILERPATTNQAISALAPDSSKLHSEFLNYCLIFFRPNWRKVAASSRKDPNITKQDILKFEIPVPPLHEQRRIAEILSSVDEAIAATRAVIEQTKKLKQGVLERLLTKGIGHTRFKQTEIGEIPEGWEVLELRDLLDVAQYGTSAPCSYEATPYPVIRIPNVSGERISFEDLKFADLTSNEATRYILEKGDLLVIRTNGNPHFIGRMKVFESTERPFLFASYLIRLRARKNKIRPEWIYSWSFRKMSRDFLLKSAATSAGNYNINLEALKSLRLAVPPISEQHAILDILSAFDAELDAVIHNLARVELLKSALMSDLLTGRRRVTDALPMAAE